MSLAQPTSALNSPRGQVIRFSLRGLRLSRSSATLATEAFRSATLSALHAQTGGRESLLLAGHRDDGSPAQGHMHAYYLAIFSGSDELEELLVVSPEDRFNGDEISALSNVRAIRWGGVATRTAVELIDLDDRSCFQVATRWQSATPYAPLRRFWGTSGKHHLTPEKQIGSELSIRLPDAGKVTTQIISETRARLRLPTKFPQARPRWQRAFFMEMRTTRPICGPVALGHSSHFGLGLFVPVASSVNVQ